MFPKLHFYFRMMLATPFRQGQNRHFLEKDEKSPTWLLVYFAQSLQFNKSDLCSYSLANLILAAANCFWPHWERILQPFGEVSFPPKRVTSQE